MTKMKAAAYIRKSTSGTDENGLERQEGSFARQKAAITDYANRNGMQIVKWYEEPASGKSIRKRKVFLQMVEDAKTPGRNFNAIIFGEYDRFMRNVREAWRYELDLEDIGVELHFSNLKNDGSMAEGMYKDVVRRMAAEYSRELARKVVQGMVRKAKMGSWLGGPAPYGYRKQSNSNGVINLIVHEEESAIVLEIFKLSLKGHGHKSIASYLNDKGVPVGSANSSRNPDGRWSSGTIRAMLRNSVYKGDYRWNASARVDCFDWNVHGQGTVDIGKLRVQLDSFKRRGKESAFLSSHGSPVYTNRAKPENEWIVKESAFPAIVPAEIFEEVQKRFRQHSSTTWYRPNGAKYLMAGGLRCKACGNNFFGHRYSKTLKGTGERAFYEYYRCSGDVKKGMHAGITKPMIRREAVDEVVIRGISERIEKLVDPERVRGMFKNRIEAYLESRPNRLASVEDEIKRIEAERNRLIEIYVKFDRPVPEDKVFDLKRRAQVLENEREVLISSGEKPLRFNVESEVELFLAGIKETRELLDSAASADRIRARNVFLDGAEVSWNGEGKMTVSFRWHKLPKFAPAENDVHLHHFSIFKINLGHS